LTGVYACDTHKERRKKKLDKMEEWRKKRKALRKILINNAKDEDLLETVEVRPRRFGLSSFYTSLLERIGTLFCV
jgi:hypothetical protein